MLPKPISIFQDISFNPNPIEDYVPMQPLHPAVFDRFCEDGWTYWSDQLFRRNYWDWRGYPCRVIVLRIRLEGFEFSSSQRKCLRRNADLSVLRRPIHISPAHEMLFRRHAQRFSHHPPISIYGFFSVLSHVMPSFGIMFDVFKEGRLIASSFVHAGCTGLAANYSIYDSDDEQHRSLGTFTMLEEIRVAIESGRQYYYPGFVYDIPSEFDYKLNFNNLEYFDWWGNWYPLPRLPVRDWRMHYEVGPPLGDYRNEAD